MDNADLAQVYQEQMLALKLADIRVAQSAHNSKRGYNCVDCDDPVEPQRLKLGLTDRCIGCQKRFERGKNIDANY